VTQPSSLPTSVSLFNRSCTVQIGPVSVSNIGQQAGLDVWFNVRKSLKPKTPNTADIRLYNLSDSTRKAIEQAAQPLPPPGGSATSKPVSTVVAPDKSGILDNTGTPVTITAGYVGATALIFQGALRSAQTVTDGPDTVTELSTGDGDSSAILARTSYNFGAGATAYSVAKQLISDMKCGAGNTDSSQIKTSLQSAPPYTAGVVLKGSSFEILCELATSCGLEVVLHNGVPLWLVAGQPTPGNAYLLQTVPQNTGVIGSPSVDTKGVLSIETLMLPGIVVGGPIQVETQYIKGLYRVCSAEWTGATSGNDFKISLEAKRYGLAP